MELRVHDIDVLRPGASSASAARREAPAGAFAALMLLNLVDAFATWLWLDLGIASEANPLLAWLFDLEPALALLLKVGMVAAGLAVLWRYRDRGTVQVALPGLIGVYAGVVAYHAVGAAITISLIT